LKEKIFCSVHRVINSDSLSSFYGNWGDEFLGGKEVRAFETEWVERFEVAHAILVNSAASALFTAMGDIGISPGDAVIVPP